MATLINGAKVDWFAYEYGLIVDGKVIQRSTNLDWIREFKEDYHPFDGQIKFRAVYVTEWWDTIDGSLDD